MYSFFICLFFTQLKVKAHLRLIFIFLERLEKYFIIMPMNKKKPVEVDVEEEVVEDVIAA